MQPTAIIAAVSRTTFETLPQLKRRADLTQMSEEDRKAVDRAFVERELYLAKIAATP